MHKSRLGGLIIDCQTADLDEAESFWARALGFGIREPKGEDGKYVTFDTGPVDLDIEVQKVEHESRVHLDIESDDIEAEAKRLEKLGAKRIGAISTWVVMEAPTGHRFCIVPPQTRDFAETANEWP